MGKKNLQSIPVSVSLDSTLDAEDFKTQGTTNKKRLLLISALAILLAVAVSGVAVLLIHLIDLFTNLSFHGKFSIDPSSPLGNNLGVWVIFIPAIGGLIVGIMALYGSKAIRGHGIPEAMEQILTNQSRIKPTITYLKPISSAVSIGTGGPFGAEGPIIATGGALGSTIGQLLKISHHERKVLLAAGATAGMSAIFGSPIAAIFLAIELLLFEFSPRSIIPVALACITGAAGHHLFFGEESAFAANFEIESVSNSALFACSVIGLVIGLVSVAVTKIVYLIEDGFEKLPIHWMWWPAIGGLVVGLIGYIEPRTLGVGYSNISNILEGNLPLQLIVSIGLFKFISWAIALGSGTSGGTLAPLLTIGGAIGAILGIFAIQWFPAAGLTVSLAALVGMSAMFTGASRAFITSIIFALETTGQSNALLPLLAACSASYIVSFFLMRNTIMTEKISRRGVRTPDSYEPDILEGITVDEVMDVNGVLLEDDNSIGETIEWLENEPSYQAGHYIICDSSGNYAGIINSAQLYNRLHQPETLLSALIDKKHLWVNDNFSLRRAIEIMAAEDVDVLPVFSEGEEGITGIISYRNILASYRIGIEEHRQKQAHISLRRTGLKLLVRGQKLKRFIKS